MQLRTLQKLGAYAVIVGAVLFAAWAVCWTFLMPIEEESRNFLLIVTNPNYLWINTLAFVGIILTIFGFTAIYSRMFQTAGWLGFFGYLSISIAYILQAAALSQEIFVYPAIAAHGPAVALLGKNLLFKQPLVELFDIIFSISILIGVLLFGAALIRSREFKKWGGVCFLAGAVIYAAGSLVSSYLGVFGVMIFAAGCLGLGLNLMKEETGKVG